MVSDPRKPNILTNDRWSSNKPCS